MRKIIFLFTLLCFVATLSFAQDTTGATRNQPKTEEKAKTSPAIWIGLGVVLFVVLIAARNRRNRKG